MHTQLKLRRKIAMCKIVLSGVNHGITIIQNRFLDEYLCDASEHELKVYLYLLRYIYSPETDVAIRSIADALGYSKAKVEKALEKWQQESLISYRLNDNGEIDKIYIEDINALPAKTKETEEVEEKVVVKEKKPVAKKKVKVLVPEYSMEQISVIASDQTFKRIVNSVEDKFGRPLVESDLKTIAIIYESLGFSEELIDYLYDYCVSKEKTSNSYIEKVAVNWAEKGIKTVLEAKGEADSYNSLYIRVKMALGKSKELTTKEKKIVDDWIYVEEMPEVLVLEACEQAGQRDDVRDNPLEGYVSSILLNWKTQGYKTLNDVEKAREVRKAAHSKPRTAKSGANQINDFPQRKTTKEEADELERKLMARNHSEGKREALKKKLGIE